MKVLAILLVLVIAVVALVVRFGGVTGFDPAQKAEKFLENVKPGSTWQQVIDVRPPKKFRLMREDDGFIVKGPEMKYDPDKFASRMQNTPPTHGFIFEYTFNNEHVYDVHFDPAGTVTAVDKAATFSDLVN